MALAASDQSLANGPTDCDGADTYIGAMVAIGCTEDSYVLESDTELSTTVNYGTMCAGFAAGASCDPVIGAPPPSLPAHDLRARFVLCF